MNIPKEDIQMEKIIDLLKKAPTDDGTFYGSLYDLYIFVELIKSANDIKNGKGITIEESKERIMKKYENYNTRYGS